MSTMACPYLEYKRCGKHIKACRVPVVRSRYPKTLTPSNKHLASMARKAGFSNNLPLSGGNYAIINASTPASIDKPHGSTGNVPVQGWSVTFVDVYGLNKSWLFTSDGSSNPPNWTIKTPEFGTFLSLQDGNKVFSTTTDLGNNSRWTLEGSSFPVVNTKQGAQVYGYR